MANRQTQTHTDALKLLDAICRDSLDAPLSHVDGLRGDYDVSWLFYKLREQINALAAELETANQLRDHAESCARVTARALAVVEAAKEAPADAGAGDP